jgi:hypothetical protein
MDETGIGAAGGCAYLDPRIRGEWRGLGLTVEEQQKKIDELTKQIEQMNQLCLLKTPKAAKSLEFWEGSP